ncbi:hypothetical protein PRIPAC_94712 [Pristionchus pacificus]|uniref:Uncharacterized protein n=1 Tax=Pristionchus pacificus TaxID=54126 RepID=A0A2A6CE32_PRIPA|nr:hypothetical protein PRIPAC_94712 [Pristionchus pacificus]|eukprot:PDM76261.1 hypothetical protein PRIPAC_39865 [Pristionchus pacificus]
MIPFFPSLKNSLLLPLILPYSLLFCTRDIKQPRTRSVSIAPDRETHDRMCRLCDLLALSLTLFPSHSTFRFTSECILINRLPRCLLLSE